MDQKRIVDNVLKDAKMCFFKCFGRVFGFMFLNQSLELWRLIALQDSFGLADILKVCSFFPLILWHWIFLKGDCVFERNS